MGCGNSKAVPVHNQHSSSSTSPDSNFETVPGEDICILVSEFCTNVKTTQRQLRDYGTVEHYLIAIIKCLSELVKELNTIRNFPESSPEYLNKLKFTFSGRFYTNMNFLGLLKSKESKGKTIFLRIFLAIPDSMSKNTTNIQKLQDALDKNTQELKKSFNTNIQQLQYALKIFMYLIILLIRNLNPKLNEYVSGQTSGRNTINRFNTIKITLLNRLDEIFNTIYNYDNDNKAQIIANFNKVLNIRKSKRLEKYNLDLSKNNDDVINKLIKKIKDAEVIDEYTESIIKEEQNNALQILMTEATGGSISYKHQIQQIRKLLTNKKLTEKQKEQYKRKINKLKLKIEKEQKLNKINEIKDKLKKANTILKNKKLTDKQKQQLQIKIKNYKNQIKKLSS